MPKRSCPEPCASDPTLILRATNASCRHYCDRQEMNDLTTCRPPPLPPLQSSSNALLRPLGVCLIILALPSMYWLCHTKLSRRPRSSTNMLSMTGTYEELGTATYLPSVSKRFWDRL